MSRVSSIVLALGVAAAPLAAQTQAELHGNYQRGNQSHQNSWGAGAQVAMTIGPKLPIAANTSLGADYLKTENGGPTSWSVSYDAVVQPGGNSMLTPYAGGSVSANWSRSNGTTSSAALGLNYIVGLTLKLEKQSSTMLKAEVRPGYVRGQEHSVTGRFGVVFSL